MTRIIFPSSTRAMLSRGRSGPGSLVSSKGFHSIAHASSPAQAFRRGLRRDGPWIIKKQFTRTFLCEPWASVLTPPAVFVGLLVTLWTYKCFMMILFQNQIIYMPSIPPFSRRENIEDYTSRCAPIKWQEQRIKSLDGTNISLCLGTNENLLDSRMSSDTSKHIYLVYFQGNASSLPPRLPQLSAVLKDLKGDTSCTIVALSYRGFWKSSGRPNQTGIEKDASATIEWVKALRDLEHPEGRIILWGQSLGAGVATISAVKAHSQISALILETPFVSIKEMLISMYPQRWLPYRYLWPFLRNSWDSETSLYLLREKASVPILLVTAEKDEVIPSDQGQTLLRVASQLHYPLTNRQIRSALHHETLSKAEGRQTIVSFARRIAVDHDHGAHS